MHTFHDTSDTLLLRKKRCHFSQKKPPEADCWPDTWLSRKKGVIFDEKKPPEADCWPDTWLLKKKGVILEKSRRRQTSGLTPGF